MLSAACLVEGDPLGGPHGGAGGYVPPDDGSAPDPDVTPPEDSGGPAPDSGVPDAEPDSGPDSGPDATPDTGSAPTWGQIFERYIAPGTKGNCASCHGLSDSSAAYQWLKERGQISGTSSPIVTSGSDFSWFGGFMPFGGPRSYPAAEADMKAWVAAGATE